MNLILFLTAEEPPLPLLIAAVAMVIVVTAIFLVIWMSRFRKVGPNEVLVVSGRKRVFQDAEGKTQVCGYRLVKGGGTFVFPVVEQAQVMSLAPVLLNLSMPHVPVRAGGSVRLQATAQVKIQSDDLSLARAAESLLGKGEAELKAMLGQMLESAFREALATRTAEEVMQNEAGLSTPLQEAAQPKLAEFGLQLVSLSVRIG